MTRAAGTVLLGLLMGSCAMQVEEEVGELSAAQDPTEVVDEYLAIAEDACRNKLPEECAQWCEEHRNNPHCGGEYNVDPEEPPPPPPPPEDAPDDRCYQVPGYATWFCPNL